MSDEATFHVEVVKLLLQMAWSDDALDPEEREHIRTAAVKWGVPDDELAVLMERLDQGQPLPVPNLKLLRQKPEAAIAAARRLMLADGKIQAGEADMLAQIKEMLTVSAG
ncbi:MAG: TerB family tellurite resistance protein [Archangiaceae bacterium]|nr:TerB family tellurite resistance protein [Archangiaceae bacterium]